LRYESGEGYWARIRAQALVREIAMTAAGGRVVDGLPRLARCRGNERVVGAWWASVGVM